LGQRVIKEVDGVTTVFHYDFNGNIIGESDPDGNFTVEYLYRGKSRSAMVDVVSGEICYFGNDRLGTPQILTDSTNTVVWEGYYKPFGEADVNPNSSVVNNFRFAGQYYDEEAGLHYNYHRYYDPRTGRYLRADPLSLSRIHIIRQSSLNRLLRLPFDPSIEIDKIQRFFMASLLFQFASITPQELNPYPYVTANPVNFVDARGLAKGDWWDPRTYVAVSFSTSFLGRGQTISKGAEQKTITFFDLGGASIDIQIGWLPSPSDITSEIGFGLGKYLGIGYFFGRPDALGNMEVGGIVFHFGLGVGSPAYISGTFPEGVDPCEF